MKALVKKEACEGIWLMDVPMPEYGPNDVLIRVLKTGICGTDVHIYNWDDWAQKTIPVPLVAGPEFFGVVEKVGSNVAAFKAGDKVSGEGHVVCGRCRNCLAGRRHLCAHTQGVGVNRNGAFAEYLAIPEANVWLASSDIPEELYAIFDPLGNAVHTTLSFDLVGEDVLITGAGPIGAMAVAVAKKAGARHVVITDINDYRLELAAKMGATAAVNVSRDSLADVQQTLHMTEGFDVGLEMSGSPMALASMTANMRHGGRIAMLGIQPEGTAMDWNAVVFKGLTIKGIYGREMYETWYKMTSMIQGGMDIMPIITHRFSYKDFQAGFDAMRSGKSGKVVLDWSQI
jgi:threonine 3-dehydrogenase